MMFKISLTISFKTTCVSSAIASELSFKRKHQQTKLNWLWWILLNLWWLIQRADFRDRLSVGVGVCDPIFRKIVPVTHMPQRSWNIYRARSDIGQNWNGAGIPGHWDPGRLHQVRDGVTKCSLTSGARAWHDVTSGSLSVTDWTILPDVTVIVRGKYWSSELLPR